MTKRSPFALGSTSLEAGTALIEASAGTGKTFTISRLFLRLMVERDFSVREILVVTYTEAATEELRDRIRQTLLDAAHFLRTGRARQADLAELLAPHRAQAASVLQRLERALTGFDEAPIFTIHGFCQRTLRDRAFESGELFDLELVPDETELMNEVTADYWRKTFYANDPVVVPFILKHNLSPDQLMRWLQAVRRQHELRILSRVTGKTLAELTTQLVRSYANAQEQWRHGADEVREILANAHLWAKGPHAQSDLVAQYATAAQNAFVPDRFVPETIAGLNFLASSSLQAGTKARASTPLHPFFTACEELAQAEEDYLTGLRIDFLQQAGQELLRRKQRRKLQSFDDLLLRLRAALRAAGGPALAQEIRQRYRAALIDEFQDTDPVQEEIFSRLFATWPAAVEPAAAAPVLFLIGDPKQAIYAFRGADIFTYRDAASGIARSYTLEQNWRSEGALVRAINVLFSRVARPFVFDFIRFQPVIAAGDADAAPLREAGRRLPPLQLWFVPRPAEGKLPSKQQAVAALAGVVASEIVRLLRGDITVGERALTARDIAVLVPENRQARVMQETLRAFGVPSVLHTEESVFGSAEAADLARVLAALAAPGQDRLLRAAWVTDFLGLTAPELESSAGDAAAWQAMVERAYEYRDQWLRHGFSAMFRSWLQTEGVRTRLLGFPDGERRLTNLLHLAEILHHAAHERQLGPAALVRWLGERIAAPEPAEEHQLRLERDDQAVRLVTIHKSKGLEYPVVFCPFSWSSSDIKRGQEEQIFCHRPAAEEGARSEFIWDLGSEQLDQHRVQAIQEKLAENLRLLYVALTRARHRCYFIWGALQRGASAATWLFHQPPRLSDPLNECLEQHLKSLPDAAMRRDLAALVEASKDAQGHPAIQLSDLPPVSSHQYQPSAEPPVTLKPRDFTRVISREWRITSFSALTAQAEDEQPDYDGSAAGDKTGAIEPDEPPALPAHDQTGASHFGIHRFPRGTGPGTCLHKIFEAIDFTDLEGIAPEQPSLETIARRELQAGGLALEWLGAVSATVRRTLQMPVAVPSRSVNVQLCTIGRGQRLNELEFQFPAAAITLDRLRSALGHVPAAPGFARSLDRLGFKPARGFIKGYIDLVFEADGAFFIVDWKSNWLGNSLEDYSPPRLQAIMSEKFYVLQYHLYTVALHLYLSRRQPGYDYDRHFGGICYLFVRGCDPERPELGVFRDRPPRQTIERLTHTLLGTP
ncbi:MAG TPA: exodeoxyribonuclease V subunit beta [Verrucomicrobiae bacterium]|nr:exodeoxyribonuclease V subunit beta [Verrucomicrobiae bacterium]